MRGTWQTTSGGGGGGGMAVLAAAAAVVAVAILGAVIHLLELVVIVFGALIGMAILGAVVLGVVRLRTGRPLLPRRQPTPWQARQMAGKRTVSAVTGDTPHTALGTPVAPVHNHFHIHLAGHDAEADAATIQALIERTGL